MVYIVIAKNIIYNYSVIFFCKQTITNDINIYFILF